MSLARSWTRQLFGASGVALLVPGTIALVLVILVFTGGFSRFGSLGQALSGPAAPAGFPVSGGRAAIASARLSQALDALSQGALTASPLASGGRHPAAVTGRSTGNRSTSGGSHAGGSRHADGGGRAGPGGSAGGGRGGSGSRGGSGPGSGTSGTGGAGGSGAGPAPAPTPATPASVAAGVVAAATAVTAKVPGPIGALATSTLLALGTTLDSILPPPLGTKP